MAHTPSETRFHSEGLRDTVARAFPRCRPDTVQTLVSRADVRGFSAGHTILDQDERERTALVVDGHVGLRRTTADGRQVIPFIATRGQLVSLLPIVGRAATMETVALSPAHVAFWQGPALLELGSNDVGLALDLLGSVLLALEAIAERLEGLMYQDAVRRVARVLIQHGDILFGEPGQLSRAYLPAIVGTSHEMTARVLRKLESDGVVERVSNDWLRLLDPVRLAEMAVSGAGEAEHVHGGSDLEGDTLTPAGT
jgi:CRP-like cAMP-binding protein